MRQNPLESAIFQGSPIATVLSGVIDFVLAFIVLLGMMLFYGIVPTINVITLPSEAPLNHAKAEGADVV